MLAMPLRVIGEQRGQECLKRPGVCLDRRRMRRLDHPSAAALSPRHQPTVDTRPTTPAAGSGLRRRLTVGDEQHRLRAPPLPDAPCAGRRIEQCSPLGLREHKSLR